LASIPYDPFLRPQWPTGEHLLSNGHGGLGAESCVFHQTDAAPAAMCCNGVVHYTHGHPKGRTRKRGWWPPFCPGSPWHGFVPPWVRCHPYAGYASMMPAPTASPALLRLRAFSAPSPSEMGILGHTAHNQLLYSLLFGLSTSGVFPVAIASAAGVSIFTTKA
jgi:hypothetical protein